jgi:adenylate cyclase
VQLEARVLDEPSLHLLGLVGRVVVADRVHVEVLSAQPSYRSLVWLGRPANIASKLTDNANKPRDASQLIILNVGYWNGTSLTYREEFPHDFVQNFTYDNLHAIMRHNNPLFRSFFTSTKEFILSNATPPILMTKAVYDGFRRARPEAIEIKNDWFYPVKVNMREYKEQLFGGSVFWKVFED